MGTSEEDFKEQAILKAFDNSQNMIGLADSKANLSITVQSLLITISLGSSLLANVFGALWDYNKTWFIIYLLIIISFIITSMIGVLFSILVYIARFPKEKNERKRKGLLYHEHISNFDNSDEYLKEILAKNNKTILEDFSKQTYSVAEIATRKMDFVNKSIWFLFTNLFLTVIILILSGLFVIIG